MALSHGWAAMGALLTAAVVSFGLAALVTPAIRAVAARVGLLDAGTDSRRVHTRPVPRVGGLAIAAGFYGALAAGAALMQTRPVLMRDPRALTGVVAGGLAILALGLYDDVAGLAAKKKLAGQLAVGLLLYASGFRCEALTFPGIGSIALGVLSVPATLLWIAGVANAMNLVDGVDGLASGIALVGAIAAFLLGAPAGDLFGMLLAVSVVGALLGFLVYNANPASIFMGDTGSLFLGTMLAALALRPGATPGRGNHVVAMAIVLAVPLADTALAMARRMARGVPVFSADREHLHHRLLQRGLSKRGAVVALWCATAVLGVLGVAVGRGALSPLAIAGAGAVGALLLSRLGLVGWPDGALAVRRRVNRVRLREMKRVSVRLSRATSMREVSGLLADAAPAVGASSLRLHSAVARGSTPLLGDGATRHRGPTVLPVDALRPRLGTVEIVWREERTTIERDLELALEVLCRGVALALHRIGRERASRQLWERRAREAFHHYPSPLDRSPSPFRQWPPSVGPPRPSPGGEHAPPG